MLNKPLIDQLLRTLDQAHENLRKYPDSVGWQNIADKTYDTLATIVCIEADEQAREAELERILAKS